MKVLKSGLRFHATLAATLLISALISSAALADTPRVVVVGGGISGLTALHELKKRGISAQLFESDVRVGGRIDSPINNYGTGLVTNRGAELVDSTHLEMLSLIKELGIPLMERKTPPGFEEGSWIDGDRVLTAQQTQELLFKENQTALENIAADQERFFQQLQDVDFKVRRKNAGRMIHSPFELELDQLGILQYLRQKGANPSLERYVRALAWSEVGVDPEKISARMFFDLFKVDLRARSLEALPYNDELYRIRGGTEQITLALAKKHESAIVSEHRLIGISSADGKTYQLNFQLPDGSFKKVEADQVILAIPLKSFGNLELNVPGVSTPKLEALADTTYGRHTKFVMYFDERFWSSAKHSGGALSSSGFQLWDSSQGQPGKAGSLTAYIDGDNFKSLAPEAQKAKILAQVEQLFPEASKHLLGVKEYSWEASYSGSFKVGEMSKTNLNLGSAQGLHFAGEHVSWEYRGYMNGAVESGNMAAGFVEGALTHKPYLSSRCMRAFQGF